MSLTSAIPNSPHPHSPVSIIPCIPNFPSATYPGDTESPSITRSPWHHQFLVSQIPMSLTPTIQTNTPGVLQTAATTHPQCQRFPWHPCSLVPPLSPGGATTCPHSPPTASPARWCRTPPASRPSCARAKASGGPGAALGDPSGCEARGGCSCRRLCPTSARSCPENPTARPRSRSCSSSAEKSHISWGSSTTWGNRGGFCWEGCSEGKRG